MIVIDIVCVAAVLASLAYRLRPDRHPDTLARRTAQVAHPVRDTGADR
jgi:hypothetical protein